MTKKVNEPKKTVYRSSDTGQFVRKAVADRNPKGTERERVRTGR